MSNALQGGSQVGLPGGSQLESHGGLPDGSSPGGSSLDGSPSGGASPAGGGRRFADVEGVDRLDAAKLKAQLLPMLDALVERLVEAVEGARVGHLIDDAEEPARQAGHELSRAAFEAALQQKVDALEASFSPSGDDGR